ncbi:fungal-specific transcription factor domain-containing protein [Colletotrichum cereale]|nr:fungal-specific transcription factor domain-containing protein [Colletotrichum cereale]
MLNLKFINTTNVPVQKRKIALHACDTCRRRKKRCEHPLGEGESPPPHTIHWRKRGRFAALGSPAVATDSPDAASSIDPCLQYSPAATGASLTHPEDGDGGEVAESIHVAGSVPLVRSPGPHVANSSPPSASPSSHAEPSAPPNFSPEPKVDEESIQHNEDRFVGDLNPEGTFLADSPGTRRGYAESNSVGVWYSRRNNKNNLTTELASAVSVEHAEHQFLAVLPRKEHYDQLEKIYLRDVHRILPVINVDILEKPTSAISQVLCKQAVCLAAGSNPSAKPYLTLGEDSSAVLTYSEFALRLSSAIRKALGLGLVKDRVQAVAILVILSLYTHFSQDRHLSAELAAQAVSSAQTVGLHLQNPPARSEDPAYLTRLFCCVWAMDQLNAAFHGRPIMMHERDLGRDMEACIAEQDSCFRLFLEIVVLLGCIIDLYRPAAKNTGCVVMEDLPSFDSLVEKAHSLGVESRLLASIELLYHGIAILSCRIPVGSIRSENLSLAHTRQSLSAIKITAIVEQFGNSLSHMTFVPYAVSLSLRVAYRELRSSKVPMLTARSRRQLQSTCKILRGLGGMFRSALVMVDLAEQVIQEIDQVCSNALNEQNANDPVGTPTTTRQGDATAAEGSEMGNNMEIEILPPHSESVSGFDASLFEGPAGFDVFEFFDPGDLNAIDAILGGDATPGFGHLGPFT